jgi:predicted amidohydrolase
MSTGAFRVGMGQIRVEGGDPDANLGRAVAAIAEAAARGCAAVVLPECLDLGWTDPCARERAEPIPGPHSDRLAAAARRHGVYVAAGLVERAGDRRYNAAVLIDPDGRIVLHHRKINELDIVLGLYDVGDRLGVAATPLGTIGLAVCADNFPDSLAIGGVLARMGAQLLLSPCSWAVDADHDHAREPYGALWLGSYSELARRYDLTTVGVSHVGRLAAGPWAGRHVIGCSLAVGPGGEVLARAPYGVAAEDLTVVEVHPRPPIARGTGFAAALAGRSSRADDPA